MGPKPNNTLGFPSIFLFRDILFVQREGVGEFSKKHFSESGDLKQIFEVKTLFGDWGMMTIWENVAPKWKGFHPGNGKQVYLPAPLTVSCYIPDEIHLLLVLLGNLVNLGIRTPLFSALAEKRWRDHTLGHILALKDGRIFGADPVAPWS